MESGQDKDVSGGELLVVDDDRSVRAAYRQLFEEEGYRVRVASNGEEAVRQFAERRPDLVLLDVMMPKMNGIVACREMRRIDPVTPILFFTAMPSEVSLVRAFGCGADDYIEKTRPPEEFLARVAAAIRRRGAICDAVKGSEVIQLGPVTADLTDLTVRDGAETIALLTRSEALVLRKLADARGCYISVEKLFDAIHGEAFVGDMMQIRGFVASLRTKLGRSRELLQNARGIGYRLV